MNDRIARELLIVAKLLTSKNLRVYRNVGEKLDNTDLNRLLVRLAKIANITTIEQARNRWLEVRASGGTAANAEWDKDRRAMLIATGFFEDKQDYLPMTLAVIHKRLTWDGLGPLNLLSFSMKGEPWLKGIVSIAKGFYKAIKKWQDSEHAYEYKNEYKVGNMTLVNMVGFSETKAKPFVDVLEKASQVVPSKYYYGTAKLTTKKEINRGSKALAYYNSGDDTLSLLVDVTDARPVYSTVHEIGHRVWWQFMSPADTNAVRSIYDKWTGGVSSKMFSGNEISSMVMEFTAGGDMSNSHARLLKAITTEVPEIEADMREAKSKMDAFFSEAVRIMKQFIIYYPKLSRLSDDEIGMVLSKAIWNKYSKAKISDMTLDDFYQLIRTNEEAGKTFDDLKLKAWRVVNLKDLMDKIWKATSSRDGGKGVFPTGYSKTDLGEFWAENFAVMLVEGESHIHPSMREILKRYV